MDYSTLLAYTLVVSGVLIIIAIIIFCIRYVFQALGFYTMAKKRGIEHAWLAWIPIVQNYIFGELVDDTIWGFGGAKWILPIGSIVMAWISGYTATVVDPNFLYYILLLVSLCFLIYNWTAYYKLFKGYSTHPVLFLVLSIIFPFLGPIFVFAIREHVYDPNGYKKTN